MNALKSKQVLNDWLQLVRLPNLPTVFGDPIAGFLLAAGSTDPDSLLRLFPAVAASLFLYISGLILNDCIDCKENSENRPDRPLPSGRIPIYLALPAGLGIGCMGIGSAFIAGPRTGAVALILYGTIFLYNGVTKNMPVIGSLTMGSCRGLSLVLGAVAGGWSFYFFGVVFFAAIGLTLYIAAVTTVSYRETEKCAFGYKRWLPAITLIALFVLIGIRSSEITVLFVGLSVMTAARALYLGKTLAGSPLPSVVRLCVGEFLRGLLFLQMTFCSLSLPYGLWAIGFLMIMWLLSRMAGKRFDAS